MRIFKNTKGAISIFLVIILVPMMTVSSLFVDASKIKLARGVAESAGDLALNTALTDYDTKLKDMYGIFATAQNTDELFEKLEDYYRTCITSSGVSDEDAAGYVDQIMAQLGLANSDSGTADILNMQLVDFDVKKKDNANLANATIVEKEIVDFMKYRAPINTGLSFISSIQSFTTLSKQTDLVDKRQDYYKKQQTVMEKLQEAWKNINNYNKLPLITEPNYFSDMNSKFNNNWESTYKESVNKKTIMDLYDTQNYVNYSCTVSKFDNQDYKTASGSTGSASVWRFTYAAVSGGPLNDFRDYYSKSVGGYDKDHLPTSNDVKTLMDSFYSNLQSMNAFGADIKNISSPVDVYDLQYLVQTMRNSLSQYTSKAVNVYTTYQKLKNAMIWVESYDETKKDEVKKSKIKVNGTEKELDKHFSDIESKFEQAMKECSGIASTFTSISESLPAGITNTSDVNQIASEIGTAASSYAKTLEDAATYLEKASQLIKSAKASVDGGELQQAKNAWKSAAGDKDLKNTSMAKQDLAEINDLGTYLNPVDMQKMIDRLDRVSANLRTNANQIKAYKFDGKFIGDIKSYDNVKSAIESKVGSSNLKKVKLSKPQLINQANGWFSWEKGGLNVGWINDSGTQVKLHGTGTDKLNLYSYLYTHFNSGTVSESTSEKTEDTSNGKDLYKNVKDKSSSAASTEAKGTDSGSISSTNELVNIANKPSKNAGSDAETAAAEVSTGENATKDTSGSLGTMFKNLSTAVVSMGTDLRDKLYVSDYILSMFSYDTIEKEFSVKNPGKELKLQSLTLTPINADNNFAYGKEVEYIIYGGENSSNLTKAYGSIYGIRLGFNLIYAFMDSSIRDTAFAIATPISAATLGVIPVPLIQAAIIVGIACCESAIDLNDIRNGQEVPLFKTQETWHCSVKGLINEAKGVAGSLIKEGTSYVIDEGTRKLGEVLDMTDEELDKYIEAGSSELTGYIGDAYDTLITRHANMAIQKLTTLANNAIEEYALNPSTDMVQYVSKGLDDWLTSEATNVDTSSDLGYIIKQEAVTIIKSQFISQVIEALQNAQSNASSEISNIGTTLMDKINQIRNQIVSKVNYSCDKVKNYKTQMITNLQNSMNEGAESVKNTLNSQIDGIFGSSQVKGSDNTGISSLLSFAYSDYLRLFLMIGLYTNEEGVLLRTADVIQANMSKKTGNAEYQLSKSAVYVEMTARIQVKPTLLALPLFADVEGNPSKNQNCYTIEYKSIKGY